MAHAVSQQITRVRGAAQKRVARKNASARGVVRARAGEGEVRRERFRVDFASVATCATCKRVIDGDTNDAEFCVVVIAE